MTFTASIAEVGLDHKPDKDEFDWGAYVDSFKESTLEIVDLAEHICRGNSFAAVFSGRPSRENFLAGQVIAVDMDTEDDRSSYDTLVKHPLTQPYGCLVFPTLSHLPSRPRHRVVFVLDQPILTVAGYEMAAKTINSFFPGHDPAVCNAGRNFFGNGRIRDEALPMWYDENVLPLDHLRVLARQWKQGQGNDGRTVTRTVTRTGGAPSLEETMARLQGVDPYGMPYHDWVRLGAAIGHTYGDGAYMQFKNWSDVPGKPGLTWKMWKSFTTDHPAPAGYGTVVHLLRTVAA